MAHFSGTWKASSEIAFKKSWLTVNLTSLEEFSWSVCECMMMSCIGTVVFCLWKWSCRLVPRTILAYFHRWSWYTWPEGSSQASGHTWREKLANLNQVLNLCEIMEVKRENCVKCWFWLGFKDRFSQVSNFIRWVGSLGTVLWVLDSSFRDPFENPQVFYALLPCVVQNANHSFWHVKLRKFWVSFFYISYAVFSYVLK